MKQKNKTTHKHNMKVVRDEVFKSNLYPIEMRFVAQQCACGHWVAGFVNHPLFNNIALPEDFPVTDKYKVVN